MSLAAVQLGSLTASRFILGGNPSSGFSHQGVERDREMRRYYTAERIKATWKEAEMNSWAQTLPGSPVLRPTRLPWASSPATQW